MPQDIFIDHGTLFRNHMMVELMTKLGLRHENPTPYYLQANDQVEATNKNLTTFICRMIGIHKTNWHTLLFSSLWAYRNSVKTTIGFTPF